MIQNVLLFFWRRELPAILFDLQHFNFLIKVLEKPRHENSEKYSVIIRNIYDEDKWFDLLADDILRNFAQLKWSGHRKLRQMGCLGIKTKFYLNNQPPNNTGEPKFETKALSYCLSIHSHSLVVHIQTDRERVPLLLTRWSCCCLCQVILSKRPDL